MLELGAKLSSSPIGAYSDPTLFSKEIEQIVHRRPLPFIASDKIKNTGDFFADEICGIPVVAVRDENGEAKVFLNVCRHRGAKLTTEGSGQNCKKFVCPFHEWSYLLNGKVLEIPDGSSCASPFDARKI